VVEVVVQDIQVVVVQLLVLAEQVGEEQEIKALQAQEVLLELPIQVVAEVVMVLLMIMLMPNQVEQVEVV
jgi:hypothetical protein